MQQERIEVGLQENGKFIRKGMTGVGAQLMRIKIVLNNPNTTFSEIAIIRCQEIHLRLNRCLGCVKSSSDCHWILKARKNMMWLHYLRARICDRARHFIEYCFNLSFRMIVENLLSWHFKVWLQLFACQLDLSFHQNQQLSANSYYTWLLRSAMSNLQF